MASDLSPAPGGAQLDNRRVAAALIDLSLPAGAAVLVFALDVLTPATAAVIVGWVLFYFFALESGDDSQTVGKYLMKLKVASVQGGRPSTGQVAVRTLLRIVDTPLALIVMRATGERRARVGDLLASTAVVDASVESTVDSRQSTEPEPVRDPLAGGFAQPVTPEAEPEPGPEPEFEPDPEPDEELVVKPVETVSALDLVMEDDANEKDGPERPSL